MPSIFTTWLFVVPDRAEPFNVHDQPPAAAAGVLVPVMVVVRPGTRFTTGDDNVTVGNGFTVSVPKAVEVTAGVHGADVTTKR